jgi:hypothetical protein
VLPVLGFLTTTQHNPVILSPEAIGIVKPIVVVAFVVVKSPALLVVPPTGCVH